MSTNDQRNRRALGLLTGLFAEAKERPGSWEAPHVEALEDRLAEVFDALTGADDQDQGDDGEDVTPDMRARLDRLESLMDHMEESVEMIATTLQLQGAMSTSVSKRLLDGEDRAMKLLDEDQN